MSMATPAVPQPNGPVVLLSDPTTTSTTVRASSILQKNTSSSGPRNAVAPSEKRKTTTCWNSEGRSADEEWFQLDFGRMVQPTRIRVQFQAGFAAAEGTLQIVRPGTTSSSLEAVDNEEIEWEDVHEIQEHELETDSIHSCTALRITFSELTDFYGRVTIYRLEVHGRELGATDENSK